jgi:hypothetical protein
MDLDFTLLDREVAQVFHAIRKVSQGAAAGERSRATASRRDLKAKPSPGTPLSMR